MATVVFGAVGAAIGGAVGGPTGGKIGWAVGALVGGQLFGPKQAAQQRGRVDDVRISGSQYNSPIPQIYGCFRVGGNIIWAKGLTEVATTVRTGGKGLPRPTAKQYTYTVDMAVGVCKGPIGDVKRIWAEDRLIWDKTVTPTITPTNITVYTGTTTQLPDSTIEGHEGVGNVSAHRGLAYVVFNDFDLSPYGNRIPAMTFEVCPNSSIADFANLQLWLEPDKITGVSDGNPIATWAGSTLSRDGSSSGSARPTYKVGIKNGLPVVRCEAGFPRGMNITNWSTVSNSSWTAYIVCNPSVVDDPIALGWLMRQQGGLGDLTLYADNNVAGADQVGFFNSSADQNIAANTTGWQILSWHLKKSGSVGEVYRNLTLLGSGTYPSGGLSISALGILSSGSPPAAPTEFIGDVGDIILFSGEHSTPEREQIINTLNARWNIF